MRKRGVYGDEALEQLHDRALIRDIDNLIAGTIAPLKPARLISKVLHHRRDE